MVLEIADRDIGGARVRMTFQTFLKDGTVRRYRADEHLTPEEVRAINAPNRRALISNGSIEVYPQRVQTVQREVAAKPGDRFIVQVGKGQFNVIEGHRLNEQPLDREAAEKLAGK
jgi:hypothetical protein